jgi:Na+-transporting NADH:ubiquinone oxidoreductase subunit C
VPEQLVPNVNRGLLSLPNDDKRKIFFVATVLCLVCSILVSAAAVLLRPLQKNNVQQARKMEILKVAGLVSSAVNLDSYFEEHVQTKLVNLESGEYSTEFDVLTFDERKAARVKTSSIKLSSNQDIAGIKRRENYSRVYLIPDRQGNISKIVLPIHGYGLWSTLYGFLALNANTTTIAAVTFYEQAETAGLGAEVTNSKWLAQFSGKQALDQNGNPMIRVHRGTVNPDDSNSKYYVDGISGATLTSNGVTNLLHFWLGELGFGPYLKKLRL